MKPAELDDTLRALVERIYVRVSEFEREAKLEPFEAECLVKETWKVAIAQDLTNLSAVCMRAFEAGVDYVHSTLHSAEGVDHEMLDQAAEYASMRKVPG